MLTYCVLGPIEVVGEHRSAAPATPKLATVLALLLCQPNRVVSTGTIADELWGDDPPRSMSTTIQTYVYQLRKLFRGLGADDDPTSGPLLTQPHGYSLQAADDGLDMLVFEQMARQGSELIEADKPDEAFRVLGRATDAWRGPVFGNVRRGPMLHAHACRLEEQLMHVRELRIQAAFMLGRHRQMIGELTLLAGTHPLNEWVYDRLIVALCRAGRRADALRAYQRLRRNLTDELGIDPSPALQEREVEVLNAVPSLSLLSSDVA